MSLESPPPEAGANAALDAVEAALGDLSTTKASPAARGRSPGAKIKSTALENWSVANVEKWFKTYKDGKYASEYSGFAGLDGAALSKLTEAEFLTRSTKGNLLFKVVQKATEEGSKTGSRLAAATPSRSRSKSPNGPTHKHNSTLHLNQEQTDAMRGISAKSPTKSSEKPKEEKETPKAAAKPKVVIEGETSTELGSQSTPKAHAVATHAKEIVKEKCDVEECDAMAVQGIYCAHHRIKPPDEDGNTSFSGSFVLGENSAESDKKLHDKLEAIFGRFAAPQTQTMDKGRWVAACESLNLVDNKAVRRLDVELVFNVIKPVKGKPVLQFEHFCRGLSQIALKKYPDKGGRSLRYMVRTDLARA